MGNKKVVLNAFVYVANNIFVKAFQFFLVPIYTAYLSPAEYGANNVITSLVSILGVIMTLSISSAISRLYAENRDDRERIKKLFGSVYLFVVLFGALIVGIIFLLRQPLSAWLLPEIDFFPVVALAIINLWITSVATQYTSMLQAMQEAKESALLNIIFFSLNLALNFLFVAALNFKLAGIFLSGIISNGLLALVSLLRMLRRNLIACTLDRGFLKDALKYSIPLIPHSLSGSISQFIARLILGNSFSLASVGLFSLAGQFGHIIDTVQSSVHSAYLPWFFELRSKNDGDAPKATAALIPVLLDLYSLFFLGFALFSQELIFIMADNSYSAAWIMIPLFVCIYAIKTPYYFYSAFLFYDKAKTRFIFIATILANLANIFIASLVIPLWGAYGSLFADLFSTVILLVIIIQMCRGENVPYFRFSLFFKNNGKLFVFMAIGLFPGLLMHGSGFHILNTLYKVLVWSAFTFFVYRKNKAEVQAFIAKVAHKKEVA